MSEMTEAPQKRTSSPNPPRTVVFAVLPGFQMLDLVGPLEVFDTANRVLESRGTPPAYRLLCAGLETPVASPSGLAIAVEPIAATEPPHTLVVPGGMSMATDPIPRAALDEIGRLADGAERIASVCAGAFVLAELGLLDGRRCTTHWLALDTFRARFPEADLADDELYVDEHPVYTAAGVSAGIDLALYLLERDLGPRLALAVARLLVVFLHRPGGQSQFSAALSMRSGTDQRIRGVVRLIAEQPAADHRVETLAERIGMSPRHFARTFRKQTGKTPAAYVEQVRVEAARRTLELTDAPVAAIASDCGFGTEETMRRSFHRALGVAPSDYRRRFQL